MTTPETQTDRAFDAAIGCAPEGSGVTVFASISDALAAAPKNTDTPYRIYIGPGDWRERVVVDRPKVQFAGAGPETTRLVFNRHAGIRGSDGQPIGTFDTAVLRVLAPDFRAANLTIENDYDFVANHVALTSETKVGHHAGQAIALAIEDEADRTYLTNVHLISHQDTLYAHAGRSLFVNCRIDGSIDYIFGGGRVVFDDCEIFTRMRPGEDVSSVIVAPNTMRNQQHGFVFTNCRLTREDGVATGSVALGRPWRRTTQFADGFYGHPDHVGAAVYMECWMDDHIAPEGWHPMNYNAKGGGKTALPPEAARLFEFGSKGPGAGATSVSRRFLTESEAADFSADRVLAGWSGSEA